MTVPDNTHGQEKESLFSRLRSSATRERMAYVGFIIAILFVGVGAGLYNVGAGFLASGVLLALFSYLLGSE